MDKEEKDDAGTMSMEKYLKSIKFPADKNSVINQAKQSGADNETVQMLQKMANKEYTTMDEIMKEMGMEDDD